MNKYVPKSCVWELTLKCNMRCIHCGSTAGEARKNELTTAECLHIADELLDLGCRQVTFIGGEVFLYKGWEKIARKLAEGGALVNIITNAFLLGDTQIDQIKYAQLVNVGISVDGMEENHNRIRNVSTSFRRVLKAFERLHKEDISTAVVTSLLDFNFYDLESLHHLLADNNVSVWQIQIATAMGSMARQKGFLLNPAKVSLVTRFIRNTRREQKVRAYAGDDVGYYDENEMYIRNHPGTIGVWHGCQAGLKVVGIDSVGNVKGCESLYSDEFIEGNLREESLEEIWFKEGNFAFNRQFDVSQLKGKCATCDKGEICRGGCRGACYFTTGSPFENAYCCYPGNKSHDLK
ncbi:MAG: radical SAM protein [Theionarchaea archaeon]|nr:radical SAM protein [Theionarchaea archaeon]